MATSDLAPIRALCEEISSRNAHVPLVPLRPALTPPGRLELTPTGHEDAVNGALLLDAARRALSWSYDHTLRLWTLDAAREVGAYFADAVITSAVVGLNMSRIFAGDTSGHVHLLHLPSG